MTAVTIAGLHKRFGDTTVLHDVSIEVPDGTARGTALPELEAAI